MTTETQTHTPGEWQVNGIDTILSVEGNCTIAKVFHPERDARLLAAAPELLDALREAESAMFHVFTDGGFDTPTDHDAMNNALGTARAAIKKATT